MLSSVHFIIEAFCSHLELVSLVALAFIRAYPFSYDDHTLFILSKTFHIQYGECNFLQEYIGDGNWSACLLTNSLLT